jgi:hypothetical protein
MSQRTLAHLYDNEIHYAPLWNVPLPPKYSVGDTVHWAEQNRSGHVYSVIVAAATSGVRCMEHHYCVRWADRPDSILEESILTLVNRSPKADSPQP